ncbi:hypothetical protein ACFVSN_30115 [Kitasatospora sp. NPDC057904]|uniref:PGAP1-like alpha/beta domain-containing protein n=1 Tax=Kitasatospora sp. NPDC057904 TaxID=3346275 RepID=UPI0036D7C231
MATIVGIHGIGQQYGDAYQLGSAWFDALRGGLAAAGMHGVAQGLDTGDLQVAFFGDLFRPAGAMASATNEPPYGPDDVRPGLERDLLTTFYQAVLEQDADLAPTEDTMGAGMVATAFMLRLLLKSPTFAGLAEHALIGNLRQVSDYLTNQAVRTAVLGRLGPCIGDDTLVVIGHSLGSVVAYEYLCQYQPASVRLLLTLGSPLGIPNLIFDRLTPAPADGHGAWPGTLPAWVNVADPDDIVALRPDLAGLFTGPPPGRVDDRKVANPPKAPHGVTTYLNARETGSALGHALAQGPAEARPRL